MRNLLRVLPVLALLSLGCSDGTPPRVAVHPVGGRVVHDGKPAAGVQVYLFPVAAPTVPAIPSNPRGVTGPDGRFSITTYEEGDGAAEGSYQVLLSWPTSEGSEDPENTTDKLQDWYGVANSPLRATVKAGGNDLGTLKVVVRDAPPTAGGEGIPGRN